jgi:hypothetical protein
MLVRLTQKTDITNFLEYENTDKVRIEPVDIDGTGEEEICYVLEFSDGTQTFNYSKWNLSASLQSKKLSNESSEKKRFYQWLDGIVGIQCRTDRFYENAWKEAKQADAEGRSFELPARDTLLLQPYSYRLT